MMKTIAILIMLTSLLGVSKVSHAQPQDERGYYLVEAEKFTPPIKEMINNFEGQPAEAFLAPDIYGEEHFLNDYRGNPIFLFFYDITQEEGRQLADQIESIADRNSSKLKTFGMAVNSKLDLLDYYDGQKPSYIVIPNGEVFGQMAYGADLGSPRLFAIDKDGIIKRVLPMSVFTDSNMNMKILEETFKMIMP